MQKSLAVALASSAVFAAAALAHDDPRHPQQKHEHSPGAPAAFGQPADPAKANRTIVVRMHDYKFSPEEITVKQGEIVRFVATNAGAEIHEMVLGTMEDLREHARMMKKPGEKMHHDEPHIAQAAPGDSAVITWQFTRPGEFHFGCLVDDHFDRGMVGRIRVGAAAGGEHPMDH